MFKLIIVTALLAFAAAQEQTAETRSFTNDVDPSGESYRFAFDTTNGIQVQESGNAAGSQGAVQYTSPEGIPIQLSFTADADGYHPQAAHLPTPPPTPEYVFRALEYIRTHPPQAINQQVIAQRRAF